MKGLGICYYYMITTAPNVNIHKTLQKNVTSLYKLSSTFV